MSTNRQKKRRVWRVIMIGLLLPFLLLARPVFHLAYSAATDTDERLDLPPGIVDDASRLNQTRVAEVWEAPVDHDDPEGQIAKLLERARREGLRVSIAGARHTMGGNTIYPGGIVLNMLPWKTMKLAPERNVLTVQAGAVWKDVIAYLDPLGRSVQVIQSNNSFSVGGSISANCHGWQFDHPPIASTVESFRLMRADTTVVRCSRAENRELFSLVLGGYGLFGVILDVDLKVTTNERYRRERFVVPFDQALETLDTKIRVQPGVQMVYARLNIVPDNFLEDVIINAFLRDPDGEISPVAHPGMIGLRRSFFRGSEGSDYGKELRWDAETRLQPFLGGGIVSRNQLQNEGVEVFQNRSKDTTDILHEYFVPRARVRDFIEEMRRLIPAHEADLLNVTLREVNEDTDTFLRFADRPMIALVLLFVQGRDAESEVRMEALTRKLIDAALENEGRYYLPYRLHASVEQFHRAYPQARQFFELKRKYDPDGLFQNQFYLKYGKAAKANEVEPVQE
jgi:FAD/FMN-containing dehydrogenase